MRNVLAVQSNLLASGIITFTDEEVEGEVEIFPRQQARRRQTQAGDLKLYFPGGTHYEIRVPMRMARYDTLLKINQIFELQDEFDVFPHYPDDTVTAYTVVWENLDVFQERWRRGFPMANWGFTIVMVEPRGAICLPPGS